MLPHGPGPVNALEFFAWCFLLTRHCVYRMHSANTKPTTTKYNTTIIYLERKPQLLFLYWKNIFIVENYLLSIYCYRNNSVFHWICLKLWKTEDFLFFSKFAFDNIWVISSKPWAIKMVSMVLLHADIAHLLLERTFWIEPTNSIFRI